MKEGTVWSRLAQARHLADAEPSQFEQIRPTVLFLQGVAALRRGETENCVDCQCRTSCILPIQPEAVHQKPDGSREAVGFFTEYLQTNPDDIGAQWLLNVASMTLGEHPDGVPASFRLPPSSFQSQVDVGRFVDIAAPLGVNRLNQAGGATAGPPQQIFFTAIAAMARSRTGRRPQGWTSS